jgi:hypothetical protein
MQTNATGLVDGLAPVIPSKVEQDLGAGSEGKLLARRTRVSCLRLGFLRLFSEKKLLARLKIPAGALPCPLTEAVFGGGKGVATFIAFGRTLVGASAFAGGKKTQ